MSRALDSYRKVGLVRSDFACGRVYAALRNDSMLVSLGKRAAAASEHPADLLLACHARIRGFMAGARNIATADDATDEAVRDTALAVVRYFTQALPRHSADEDLTIAPRLHGRDATVDAALETIGTEHAAIDPRLVAMCDILREIARDPSSRRAHCDALRALVDDLDARWARHLGLEETIVVPAVRALSSSDLDAVLSEMRARRNT